MQPENVSKIAKTRAHYLALTPEKGLIFEKVFYKGIDEFSKNCLCNDKILQFCN